MSRQLRCVLIAASFAALLLPARGSAQSVAASNTPIGTIAPSPVSGGGVRVLDFGSIAVSGTADSGAGSETNTSTAKWEFGSLKKSATVVLTFTLPTLTKGTSTLPVIWANAGYGSWCTRRAPATAGTCGTPTSTITGTFNPGTLTATATTPGGAGNNDRILTIWMGGRVGTLPVNTVPGLYSGTITLTINVI